MSGIQYETTVRPGETKEDAVKRANEFVYEQVTEEAERLYNEYKM